MAATQRRPRAAWTAAASTSPSSTTDAGGSTPTGDDATTPGLDDAGVIAPTLPPGDGGAPAGFWDSSDIPAAKNVMMFKFLNRTNGKYSDGEVYWSFKSGSIDETHSIADQPTYDMPANNSGRMYFYLCATGDATCASDPTKSQYYDFIEFTIGATQFNGNTTRVDAFGIKIAMRMHCADGYDVAVGEDYATFLEDRAVTFQSFINEVPPAFQALAQAPYAPYRIVQPGTDSFKTGGANADYYDSFVDSLWAANGITVTKPGPNGSGLGSYPDLSAAIMTARGRQGRHVQRRRQAHGQHLVVGREHVLFGRADGLLRAVLARARLERQGVRLSVRRRGRVLELHLALESAVHDGRHRLVTGARAPPRGAPARPSGSCALPRQRHVLLAQRRQHPSVGAQHADRRAAGASPGEPRVPEDHRVGLERRDGVASCTRARRRR